MRDDYLKGDTAKNWTKISESQFPWEREALDFIQQHFPAHKPYRAWSNFEFIAEDGSINEVDLLVFSRQGFFLIEIKSHPGHLSGDAGTWRFEHDGRVKAFDNPLYSTNLKAKKLSSLLGRQKRSSKKGRIPFLEALVFCSAPELKCDLEGTAHYRLCLRDRDATSDTPKRNGIMAAITRRECQGLRGTPKGQYDQPMAKVVSQVLDKAGIRPRQQQRKVSDYLLKEVIDTGPGYQDWLAVHAQVKETKRLVRLYNVRLEAKAEDRKTIERAAKREFQLLETLHHPGILRALGFTEHELGPALILEYESTACRLDLYLTEREESLSAEQRLHLIRQVAEVVRFAHEKKVIHRAISPCNILVINPESERPGIRLYNWQIGYRESSTTSTGIVISKTSHIDRLVDDKSTAFMAPESSYGIENFGEHVDIFSLGALAYYIFSGVAPAENSIELSEKLRGSSGLQISAVLNGAGEGLQDLIQFSTHPDVTNRLDSVTDFLELLDLVEDEIRAPEHDIIDIPENAQNGDILVGNLTVVRRLGRGSTSIALLVQRGDEHLILKAATDPEYNQRMTDEAEVLQKLRHQHIVAYCGQVTIGNYIGILLRPAFSDKGSLRIETLGDRLRKEGRLHIDLLQRFGEDLIGTVSFLEEQGISHRDIKPDNIAVGMVGHGSTLHLVLFDFSLSRASADNIRAGTRGYLDPILPNRKRWDLHAERYTIGITLYELATGALPKWGDGKTDPSHLSCEITIEAELFDANLREGFTKFFQQGLRRDAEERFDNAEDMLRAWRTIFEGIGDPGTGVDSEDEEAQQARLDAAAPETQIHELGLGIRVTNALDRLNVVTVLDLLHVNLQHLQRQAGVSNTTRRDISHATRRLRKRLGDIAPPETPPISSNNTGYTENVDVATMSVDLLVQRITRTGSRAGENTRFILHCLLGLAPDLNIPWPSQIEVAHFAAARAGQLFNNTDEEKSNHSDITRVQVGNLLTKFQNAWTKEASITRLRGDLAELLEKAGGVMAVQELTDALLAARGSVQEEPQRTQQAMAVIRAAVEVERRKSDPRFLFRRTESHVLIAINTALTDYAVHLGKLADKIAAQDPLIPPVRVVERLHTIKLPEGDLFPLSDARLVRLAAAVSQQAAVSSRQELYPRGMDAARVLKLAQGALLGIQKLTLTQITARIQSRYPEAAPLPNRPMLDILLHDTGFDLEWDSIANDGHGCYVNSLQQSSSFTHSTDTLQRRATVGVLNNTQEFTPEIADARQFEERLQRGITEGAFFALLVNPKYYHDAIEEFEKRFPVEVVDFEGLLLTAIREAADKAQVNWDLVVQADSTPGAGDWDKMILLVRRAMPQVEAQLLAAQKTIVLIYPGLLARYGQIDLIERL
ncbi:MAG: BREX system serine/threonine kinase PglW, partial [Candidatus Hydrogenedentes bacterium]|nr:BREX system serine/threonine kinase PglW [Candidatus Hydrogenedentota bacterium]